MINFLNDIGVNTQPQFWISVVQIIWINVLLSGDNAIVIALACRNLPQKQRFTGMVLGTGVALLLRLVFATTSRLPVAPPCSGLQSSCCRPTRAPKTEIHRPRVSGAP